MIAGLATLRDYFRQYSYAYLQNITRSNILARTTSPTCSPRVLNYSTVVDQQKCCCFVLWLNANPTIGRASCSRDIQQVTRLSLYVELDINSDLDDPQENISDIRDVPVAVAAYVF